MSAASLLYPPSQKTTGLPLDEYEEVIASADVRREASPSYSSADNPAASKAGPKGGTMGLPMGLHDIDVLILCGGLGKRLRSEVGETQKVLAAVDGRPFLDLVLKYLARQGFKRIVLCTGYKGELVEKFYKENPWGLTIEFSKEAQPLGTGGAIKNAKRFVQSERFFILNGDCFCAMNYSRFLKFHLRKKALATLSVSRIKNKKDFGSIVLGVDDHIQGFLEKISKNVSPVVNTGIYCFEREIFRSMPRKNKFSIETEFFPRLVGKKFFGFHSGVSFLDIGTPERYKQASKLLKKR